MTTNFDLWKRVAQAQYPGATDAAYQRMLEIAAADWGLDRDTNVAKLFEQYVMLKQLMKPEEDRDGN